MADGDFPRLRRPYLHRNWITAINHWQNVGARLRRPSEASDRDLDQDQDDDRKFDARPTKRRRLWEEPQKPLTGREITVCLFPEEYGECEYLLKLEVLKITHKDSARPRYPDSLANGTVAPPIRDVTSTRARCRVTISSQGSTPSQILHCDSQICTIKSFRDPASSSRIVRIYQPTPFVIPQDKFFTLREGDDVFHLADNYSAVVELESVGDDHWPPQHIVGMHVRDGLFGRQNPSRHWVLSATLPGIRGRKRNRAILKVKTSTSHEFLTDFVLDVDVRWATGCRAHELAAPRGKEALPSITVVECANGEVALSVNGDTKTHLNGDVVTSHQEELTNGHANGTHDEFDEDMDGELTPSRSLRTRQDKVYNLKLLSDKAHGTERRRQRKLHGGQDSDQFEDDCRVTYHMRAVRQTLDDFKCCLCQAPNQNINQLQAHVLSHADYDFDFEPATKAGYHVAVSHRLDALASPLRPRIYQLGKPREPFDLERYIEGDDAWITSRLGPLNDVPQKVTVSRPSQKVWNQQTNKKVLVPATKQPLFDPLSKAQLEPGTVVRPQFADSTWLIQKHRETLQDFVDVDADEKEYMTEWDTFIFEKHLCSDQYLPQEFLAFVRERGPWLAAKKSRMVQFGKHLIVLIGRGALEHSVINEVIARVTEVRSQKLPDETLPLRPESLSTSSDGCALCGLPVLGPMLLVCSNEACERPIYHDYCVQDTAKMPVESSSWLCNACLP